MIKKNELPSQEYLKECFDYNPETGELFWKERPRYHFKTEAGWKSFNTQFAGKLTFRSKCGSGYYFGKLNGKNFKTSRIVYKILNGVDPDIVLHKDGNKTDNRPGSLSSGTSAENSKDLKKYITNKSGIMGVNFCKNKWVVTLNSKYIGSSTDFFEACCMRKSMEVLHNYHPSHGKR